MKIVKTKEEFESLVKSDIKEFIVVGELAEKLQKTQKLATMGKISIGLVSVALIAIPFTGGTSALAAAAPIAGMSLTTWLAIISFGIILIAFYKDYDVEIVGEFTDSSGNTFKGAVKCTKKKK